jgi:hypothetical protein
MEREEEIGRNGAGEAAPLARTFLVRRRASEAW